MRCKICGNEVWESSVDDLCFDCEVKYNQTPEDVAHDEKIYNQRKGERHDY